jgi:hypothetical protein
MDTNTEIIATVYDEASNMATVVARIAGGKLSVRLFDIESEQYAMEGTIYPASMEEAAWRKAFSIGEPEVGRIFILRV